MGIPLRTANPRPGEPAFTEQDVRDHVARRPVGLVRVRAVGPASVETVEFLAGRAVAARLRRGINQPDEALLCLVTLSGTFTVEGGRPPLPGQPVRPPDVASRAYQVYDARTGELLSVSLG